MIVTETIVIYGMQFTRTYSDKGFYITCDDEEYSCAIDPVNSERQYAETEKKDRIVHRINNGVEHPHGWRQRGNDTDRAKYAQTRRARRGKFGR